MEWSFLTRGRTALTSRAIATPDLGTDDVERDLWPNDPDALRV